MLGATTKMAPVREHVAIASNRMNEVIGRLWETEFIAGPRRRLPACARKACRLSRQALAEKKNSSG